ncbi:MAG: methionine--tRNA ligase [Candidatus Diapherotrites archaeon]|nr:methionine--tRNA ligase [Candidatus Diapherotrites archaeon]
MNSRPHLGHLIGSLLPPDIYVRFLRLRGEDAIYICGTDEHGTATEIAAEKAGVTPEEWCARMHKLHKEDYEWFEIEFTNFGRTSSKSNHELTQYIFKKNYEKGYIFEKETEQWYCNKCKRFLPDRYVKATCPYCGAETNADQCDSCGKLLEPHELIEPRCVICGSKPELKQSKHLFLDLPKFAPKLKQWISSNKHWSQNVRNWALSLCDNLKPRCITRDLKWGVKVPLKGYEDKVFYVWFDAPIGYIAITKDWNEKEWHDWWTSKETRLIHFLGKDNIPFHTIIFPAMLMGTEEFILPYNIIAAEYLNYEGKKFSKSKGIGVTLEDARNLPYPPDYWRYALVQMAPETHDSDFTWKGFQKAIDELADVLGNFVHRSFILTKKFFNSEVPKPEAFTDADKKLIEEIEKAPGYVAEELSKGHLREASKRAMELVREANAYLNQQEPWKNEGVRANTLYLCLNVCRSAAILFEPFMPAFSSQVWAYLNLDEDKKWEDAGKLLLKPGHKINESKPIFKKIGDDEIEKWEKQFSGEKEAKPMISYDEFAKLDLRVAQIKHVEKVEGADKLLKIVLDVGELGERTVAAGLAPYYKPEELVGKNVVYLANLQPRKLRGVLSQGMILAGEKDNKVKLLECDLEPGAKVL